jgi:dTDP-glucose 4,6-dehydratase
MNLLVTGGAGFIGSALVRWLLDDSAQPLREELGLQRLVNLDALTYAGSLANLGTVEGHPIYRFEKGDIADGAFVEQVFHRWQIDAVIHLAAETHVDRSIDDPMQFIRTNVQGTCQLLESARRAWKQGKGSRFVHVSTDEVFGSLAMDEPAFTERTPYGPNSPYAASKAASDHLARAYFRTYGLPVVISNCSNNYGPHQFPEKLIPLMILNALEGKPLPVYGDGRQVRDWLYVEDHVRGLVDVLRAGQLGESYAFGGGGDGLNNLKLVRMLCATLDRVAPRSGPYADLVTFVADRPGHDLRYAIDSSKARRELGWQPQIELAEGLERTVTWYLRNRSWCDAITRDTYQGQRLGLG